jgi:hypothetical protein
MLQTNWRKSLVPGYMLFCVFILPLHAWLDRDDGKISAAPRRLVVVLDGVPYQTMAELRAEGRFARFHDPARMISTFPSSTNPAMVEILRAEDSPGYEDHYYDREQNRLVGGIQDRLQGGKFIRGTFRETFDYHAPAFKGALAYVAAPMSAGLVAQADLLAFKKSVRNSQTPLFVAYIGETDSLAHLGGEQPLKAFLRTFDRAIEELIAESGGHLEVEMFSDHGNRYDAYRHVKLNDALAAGGFVTEKRLQSPNGVVLPKYGLVGSAQLFTLPELRARVAEVCAATEGVDFAVYVGDSSDKIELLSQRGRAQLHRREGRRFKYEALAGDPLALAPIVASLRADGRLDAEGFADEEDWRRRTLSHPYVDPLRRLFGSFNAHVKNRADVIASFADGYLIGSPFMSIFAEMRATHGNLLRGETEGFAMSTRQVLAPALCGAELNALFGLDQRSKADLFSTGSGHCRIGPALAQALLHR